MAPRVTWTFSGKRATAERKKQRAGIILRDAGVTEKTKLRYYINCIGIRKILKLITMVRSMLQLDEQICDWIQYSWEHGLSLHVISDAFCGFHNYEPWAKKQILKAWKLFSIWRKFESPDRVSPLTHEIVYSWMNYAIDHNHLIFAGLLGLGFFALLRTGELLKVTAEDLLLDQENAIVS